MIFLKAYAAFCAFVAIVTLWVCGRKAWREIKREFEIME